MKKKIVSWPKPKGFRLDDDSGLLIGNRIHRVVGGQVIGQQVVHGDAVNTFGAPGPAKPAKRRATKARPTVRRKPAPRVYRAGTKRR